MNIILLSTFATVVGACDNRNILPVSGMRPYEILVVADNSETGKLADSILSLPIHALSQPEPQFDVSLTISSDINNTMSLARVIVVVETDSKKYRGIKVKYECDVWAKPQLIVHISAPTVWRLRQSADKWGSQVSALINRFETNEAISTLKDDTCAAASRYAATIIGWTIKVPGDMSYIKRGRDFIWFSDNGNETSKNICLYTYHATSVDSRELIRKRDSIMARNIPGERQGMFMQTAGNKPEIYKQKYGGNDIMICRTLWEMKADAMGGPLVCHALLDSSANKVIVAEAFVYAPSAPKRNKMRYLEALLYTLSRARKQI